MEKPPEAEVLEERKPAGEPEGSKLIMEFPDDSMVDASMDQKDATLGTISTDEKENKDSGGSGAVSESNLEDQSKANGQGMPQIQASLDDSMDTKGSSQGARAGAALAGGKKKKKKKKKPNPASGEQAILEDLQQQDRIEQQQNDQQSIPQPDPPAASVEPAAPVEPKEPEQPPAPAPQALPTELSAEEV